MATTVTYYKIANLTSSMIDTEVKITGWVSKIHRTRKTTFIWLYEDHISMMHPIQIVCNTKDNNFDCLLQVTKGFRLNVFGILVKSIGSMQDIEIRLTHVEIVGQVKDPSTYQLAKDDYPMKHYRDNPELECHSIVKRCIYVVRARLMKATELFFELKNMLKVDMPLMTTSQCEGGANPAQVTDFLKTKKLSDIPTVDKTNDIDFTKDFTKSATYLTESNQLFLETCLGLGDIWTETIATRYEPSESTKHLASFKMIEVELANIESAVQLMDFTEEAIKFCIKYIIDNCSTELDTLDKYFERPIGSQIEKLSLWLYNDFVRINHADVIDLLAAQPVGTFEVLPTYSDDLSGEHERWLTDTLYGLPVIVARYPKAVKSFYMPVILESFEESRGVEHVDSYDILLPDVGELVGGSRRIHDADELRQRISDLGIAVKPLEFYIRLRENGTVPHGGFGWGHERFVKGLTGAPSVKDVVQYPFFIGCFNENA
jgi:asparaginyl-tRNA synthetase